MPMEILNNTEVYKVYSEVFHPGPPYQSHSPEITIIDDLPGVHPCPPFSIHT